MTLNRSQSRDQRFWLGSPSRRPDCIDGSGSGVAPFAIGVDNAGQKARIRNPISKTSAEVQICEGSDGMYGDEHREISKTSAEVQICEVTVTLWNPAGQQPISKTSAEVKICEQRCVQPDLGGHISKTSAEVKICESADKWLPRSQPSAVISKTSAEVKICECDAYWRKLGNRLISKTSAEAEMAVAP